jgi:DNA-binding MarR family transcriptional regulator
VTHPSSTAAKSTGPRLDPDPGLSRHTSLGYQVNLLGRLFTDALRRRLEPLGVAPGQFGALLVLYEADGLTQTELSERLDVEQPTMANTLSRMQRDGLITREPDPHDRRRSLVRLTASAHELRGELIAAAQVVNATAVEGLVVHDIDSFMNTLKTLIRNLDRKTDPAIDSMSRGS